MSSHKITRAKPERPQGFEDGKLAKRGLFRCFWGCEVIFPSKEKAACHVCPARTLTYLTLVEMNILKNLNPPVDYLKELGIDHGLCTIKTGNSIESPNKIVKKSDFCLKYSVEKTNKLCWTQTWINESDFSSKPE